MTSSPLTVRTVTAEQHLEFLRSAGTSASTGSGSASFLQTPAWARVKSEWRHESIGWFSAGDPDSQLLGVGLVLYRQLPRVQRFLAYLPEGPVIDWAAEDLRSWLSPMVRHVKHAGAFGVRIGPPVVTRRWDAATVKAGVADPALRRLGDIPPTERSQDGARVVSQLNELGWRPQSVEGGFAAGQPQFNFMVPLTGRTEADLLAGMNQQWRRNIKKADKAGVQVTHGGPADLPAFHGLYALTAERDHFPPRPLAYFEAMGGALSAAEPDR